MNERTRYETSMLFMTRANSEHEAYWTTSNAILPAIRQSAKANGIEIAHPGATDPKISTVLEAVDAEGWYIETMLLFWSTADNWQDATVWLRSALASVHDPNVHLLAINEARSFYS